MVSKSILLIGSSSFIATIILLYGYWCRQAKSNSTQTNSHIQGNRRVRVFKKSKIRKSKSKKANRKNRLESLKKDSLEGRDGDQSEQKAHLAVQVYNSKSFGASTETEDKKAIKIIKNTGEIDSGIDLSIDEDYIYTGMPSNWERLQKKLGVSSGKINKDTKKHTKTKTKSADMKNSQQLVRPKPDRALVAIKEVRTRKGSIVTAFDADMLELRAPDKAPGRFLALRDSVLRSLTKDDLKGPPELKHDQEEDGKFVALDCEFVGVGRDGARNALGRISIVNYFGKVVMDEFVRPTERVTDWRTDVSGVTPRAVRNARTEEKIMPEVVALLHAKVLVGHALENDFKVLNYNHPRRSVRDTAHHKPFCDLLNTNKPSLKVLSEWVLGLTIQSGEHSSVEDAQTAMLLYRLNKNQWRA